MSARTHVIARVHRELAQSERDHSCHVFPLPAEADFPGDSPKTLEAYCGYTIAPGEAEVLEVPSGLPCTACLLSSMLQG